MFADANILSLGYLWLIVNIIWNLRGNLSVLFTMRLAKTKPYTTISTLHKIFNQLISFLKNDTLF